MTFPLPLSDNPPAWISDPAQLKGLRQKLIDQLVIKLEVKGNLVAEQLAQISETLNRSAATEITTFENGGISTSATGSANLLTRQVERALAQVLGRTPGQGSNSFVKALNDAFPMTANGDIVSTPSRSAVSLYGPENNGGVIVGQLSVQQANLYRQGNIIGTDALRILASLEPFDPIADIDAVEALRTLIQSQISSLVEEFGRLDEPRPERVNVYFSTLVRSVDDLGQRIRLTRQIVSGFVSGNSDDVFPVTLNDEAQTAAYELLKNYVATLNTIWLSYIAEDESEQLSGRYSARLSRSNILLPVIAGSNQGFMNSMDAIGFTISERRSDAALFTTLGSESEFTLSIDLPLGLRTVKLPDITVNDFNEWVDRFANLEAPSILGSSGRFGLDFVTDQADTLFWVIAFVLDYLKPPVPPDQGQVDSITPEERTQRTNAQDRFLGRVLSFDRVDQSLKELLFQLNTLADLGVS
jgi:hypothetical protein